MKIETNSFDILPKVITQPHSWVEHIPFAFFLVEQLKPSAIVELGVHTGNSYNAFCQAVKHFKFDTKCFGVDTWEGDEHAGFYPDEIFQTLANYQEKEYKSFSTLLRSTFDEALISFPDHSIDLLHIDGLHTYEAVKHDFETWLPKMSTRGVIIFHDTNVYKDDFGVWKFWKEIADQYTSHNFLHGHGLGLLAVGKEVSGSFQEFIKDAASHRYSDDLFRRLGSALLQKAEQDDLIKALENKVQLIAKEKVALEQVNESLKQEINWMVNSKWWKLRSFTKRSVLNVF